MSIRAAAVVCLTAVVVIAAAPAALHGAERMVLGEYFTMLG
jgi:hypothetical protein